MRSRRLFLEQLEIRSLLAIITVTSSADDLTPNDGAVSLREAITAVNASNDLGDPDITAQNPGTFGTSDAVHFNISGSGVHTISPASALPALIVPMIIDGYTQPGVRNSAHS
jgi:CSLREA domain-containing protein